MANNDNPSKIDPIQSGYYRPLKHSELVAAYLFYLGGIASFFPIFIEQKIHPVLYSTALIAFVILVVFNFIICNANRLYFFPRAEDARRKELLSNAFNFDLTHERTSGYYNNNETDPIRRIGLSTLENLFFSKSILRKMAPSVRTMAIAYFMMWITALLWRDIPLDWISTAAQVIFTEEIISRWLRLEWARNRTEYIFDMMHHLYQLNSTQNKISAYVIAAFSDYESGKMLSGILLSQRIFNSENKALSAEWEIVKAGLPLELTRTGK